MAVGTNGVQKGENRRTCSLASDMKWCLGEQKKKEKKGKKEKVKCKSPHRDDHREVNWSGPETKPGGVLVEAEKPLR